jgi:hypothetical protein
LDSFSKERIPIYLDQTERYIIPMALSIPNIDFVKEIADLIIQRRELIKEI